MITPPKQVPVRATAEQKQRWYEAAERVGLSFNVWAAALLDAAIAPDFVLGEIDHARVPPPLPSAPPSGEEEYVAREVEITRRLIEAGQLKDVDDKGKSLNRLKRTEAYARMRWQGVQEGTVASL